MEESGYIAIVDYGLGNVGSVRNALTRLGAQVVVTNEQSQLRQANGLILPGVGAFGDGMQKLRDLKLDKILSQLVLEERKPILGICLGMQLMASMGLEHGEHPGLGWFDATVQRLPVEHLGLKIPHVGWNNVIAVRDGKIFDTTEVDACFYFVHGYHVELASSQDLVGTCDYGIAIAAIIQKGNILGTQFHPEKSQKAGLALLGKFLAMAKRAKCRMLKKRLIPCLFLKNGFLVRSEKFSQHQLLGNAVHQVDRFNAWNVDELIYIDITQDDEYDIGRDDMKVKGNNDILQILDCVAKSCFMPLTFGGRIRTMQDIHERVSRGADKVTINTQALKQPGFITEASRIFGSQAIIVSIDVLLKESGQREVVIDHGRELTGLDPVKWALEAERLGAGEIFLNSVDRDGTGDGYDIELITMVAEAVSIPVIACGGVGHFKHFAKGIIDGHAHAVAAGNIFHFTELSANQARKALLKAGVDVRPL